MEEAKEMLCSHLGDLEADTVTQARVFHHRNKYITEQLNEAKRITGRDPRSSQKRENKKMVAGL